MNAKVDQKMRLDKAIALYFNLTRTKAQKYIEQGKVKVDGKIKNASYMVLEGNILTLEKEEEDKAVIYKENIFIDVLYEDDDLVVVNKPSGMVVHPAPGHSRGTLVNALSYRFSLSKEDTLRPGIVHRLDKDTSGLMIVAKNDKAHELLSQMISKKEVLREYLAIVDGVIPNQTGTIHAPIGRDPKMREKMKVTDINAKDAITHFKVLKRNHTLIQCRLETGRTHQIRVHLAYIGYPVSNDPVYGKEKNPTPFGQYLHSYHLSFKHPITLEQLEFKVNPPQPFLDYLEQLKSNIE